MKRALILDLDNTIYPVSSIAGNLFDELFTLLDENLDTLDGEVLEAAKLELTRRPYQWVADKYNFNHDLKSKGIELLKNITYDEPMQTYEDYHHVRSIPVTKFLVTTGFTKLQWSKVRMLNIEDDFEEIHIVDPELSASTKKDVFAEILKRYNYKIEEVLIIGDDPHSEIKAAAELGIDTFLYDPDGKHTDAVVTYRAKSLEEVKGYLS